MALEVALAGQTLGVERPLFLLALPLAAAALWWLVLRRSPPSETGRRPRLALFSSRLLLVCLLVTAAAVPYTVTTKETPGEPRVTMLVDESESMAIQPGVADGLARGIESQGVPVQQVTIASGTDSPIGDAIIANTQRDGSLLVVSDGRVTDGRSITEAAELARGVNATISTVRLESTDTERAVRVTGPAKTSVGVENRFLVTVDGVGLEGTETQVTVEVDGTPVLSEPLSEAGSIELTQQFEETGTHRITARIDGGDRFAENDVYRTTIRVTERPQILYVAQGSYPFEDFLSQLYEVTRAEEVPSELDQYTAVVIQDLAAEDLGDVAALQEYVINGNGLVVAGGENAYDGGGYADSPIAATLPVRAGDAGGRTSRIVLLVDVSGSTEEGMRVQKAIALDVLDQLGDEHNVGLVAFNYQAYRVADLRPLSESRADLDDRIRRLRSGGGTTIAVGLRGAADMLGDRGGSVILISDGGDRPVEPLSVARSLGEQGIRVYTVGVGQRLNADLMRAIAAESGGSYFRADETSRLRILFGGTSREYAGTGLTIVDDSHFITSGVEVQSDPQRSNDVTVKDGASFLVADRTGTPALAAWRFGLGRVVSITAYGADGTLDGLLTSPDSLLLTKSVNWAIGDPERKSTGVIEAPDTRVGVPTAVVFRGDSRPTAADARFVAVGEETYRAQIVPTEPGYRDVLDAAFAVNYPHEDEAFGQSTALEEAVGTTGGRVFAPGQSAAIAEFVRRQSTGVRTVREEWDWALLSLALVLFLVEVAARRLYVYRGRTVA